jgi:Zn-dependent M28 family amino/carboxypeptidase
MSKFVTVVTLAALVAACGQKSPPVANVADPQSAAIESVTGGEIRRHMELLAADDMQGREAGTEFYQRAADYVVSHYKAAGLKALGDDGSYFQGIQFFETRLIPESARFSLQKDGTSTALTFRDDFIRGGGFGAADEEITADLAFVGHGIVAPELGHDDYADIDVTGKILVVLSGAPPGFDTDRRAFYSSSRGKADQAVARGAVGMIGVRTPVDQARRPWARYLPGIGSPGMRWIDAAGNPYQGFPELAGSAAASESGAEKIFALSGHDLAAIFEKHAAGETGSFDLGVSATLARSSTQRRVMSANVVGVLEGSDPGLKNEYVVYTGHLDHIGLRPGKDGDDIHNGAYDNAAGVGSILEIAQAMAGMPSAPRRSVIFAMVTAEEKGLQGSSFFTKNPPVPVNQLVANINIDMPYLGFPVNDVHAFGAEHSTLFAPADEATKQLGMQLTPDPKPEEVRFIRSDQFSFVLEGIPAVAFKAGMQSSDPAIDGEAALDDFLKNHYHQSSDDLSLPYSPEGAERFARAGLLMGMIVANADERPRWVENDFFGDKFAK